MEHSKRHEKITWDTLEQGSFEHLRDSGTGQEFDIQDMIGGGTDDHEDSIYLAEYLKNDQKAQ